MPVNLQVKSGDNRVWTFTTSDASSNTFSLTDAQVEFSLKAKEWATQAYFVRDTDGIGSDYISVTTPASDGIVTITPTVSDWAVMSDNYGIFIGEFKVTDSDSIVKYTKDIVIDVQEALL